MGKEKSNSIFIIVAGAGAAGKSALICQFTIGRFVEVDPYVGDEYSKDITINGLPHRLRIFDCAGCDEYFDMGLCVLDKANGFIFVYDITKRDTFEEACSLNKYYVEKMGLQSPKDLRVVVCGNKCDIADQRQIDASEGRSFADLYGYDFFETSAKTGLNVEEAFMRIAERCIADNEDNRRGNCTIC